MKIPLEEVAATPEEVAEAKKEIKAEAEQTKKAMEEMEVAPTPATTTERKDRQKRQVKDF